MCGMTTGKGLEGGKCRLLPDPALVPAYQQDAIYSDTRNVCERAGNELAACKTLSGVPENENPGALSGTTGADSFGHYKTEQYRQRAMAATALCHAIGECHPHDAAYVMQAAFPDLAAGMPIAPLNGVMEQAEFWADLATPRELDAYAFACTTRMAPARRAAFLT